MRWRIRGDRSIYGKIYYEALEYLENVVGVEINFNKVFYKPEKLRTVEEKLRLLMRS
ncbi:MAG: hypothetical protein HWQ38_34660 [Nostoc sp. NMS7]|uniref:hypothetical protein n=1 Tax=Nostoc sp. NMS7 TaxID=2815391 RepID=UPI0025ECE5E7|nr:hypothetical protein [Nostoc sp. NMS7]MBN3951337.1 hypothetical protein [Nostoc sp. NMS7]